METTTLKRRRANAAILATVCIALAFLSISCGAGGTVAIPAPVDAPAVALSPVSLSFPGQAIDTSSSAQSVKLTNTGSAALAISSIVASGDFGQTNNCGTSVATGNNCTISVTFTPTGTGTRTGAVAITDNASGSPHAISLSGTGTGTAPVVSLSATSLSFGNQSVGTTSTAQTATLRNTGNATLSITSVAVSGTNPGDFAQTNACGSSVAAGANCTISVTFTPSASGTRRASVSITDNASASPQTVSLSGTGTAPAPVVSLSPTQLSLGSLNVGTASTAQTVTLANTGNATLSITSIAVTGSNAGDFAQTNTCGSSVATGANCTISVTFTPSASGPRTTSLNITDNASGSPQTVSLTGTGNGPVASLSATSLSFGNQPYDATSTAQTLTLSNPGNAALSITSLAVTGTNASDFAQTTTCGSSVAAGANCAIAVIFTPSGLGTHTAELSISDNAIGSPQTIPLSGTGAHYMVLSWTASTTSGVVGYNAYRGPASSGPFSQLNSSPVSGTTFTDAGVQAGQTSYYVVTAIASDDVTESANSNVASATVPSP